MAKKRKFRSSIETPWTNITDVIPGVFQKIARAKKSRPKNLDEIWNNLVDPKYREYTRVERIVRGTLYVKVLSGSVYSELVMTGTEEIEKRMKNFSGFSSIKRVVYRR